MILKRLKNKTMKKTKKMKRNGIKNSIKKKEQKSKKKMINPLQKNKRNKSDFWQIIITKSL